MPRATAAVIAAIASAAFLGIALPAARAQAPAEPPPVVLPPVVVEAPPPVAA